MQELFRKYLDNQCSPEEVKKLLAYFNDPENEVLLRELIAESLANSDEAMMEVNGSLPQIKFLSR